MEDGVTFIDKNHKIWPERFKYASRFSEDLALVLLEDGWTVVDKNHNLWPERFKHALRFNDGIAPIKLEDSWTFVDKNHNFWPERFIYVLNFNDGLAPVELEGGWAFVDKEHNVYLNYEKKALRKIYEKPIGFMKLFLSVPLTAFDESIKNENFMKKAVLQVENGLRDLIKKEGTITEEYAKALKLFEKFEKHIQKNYAENSEMAPNGPNL